MRYFLVLFVVLAVLMTAGCQGQVSATQPSPVLMLGETVAYNKAKGAANKAYQAGKLDYPQYASILETLSTLRTRALTNGGIVTIKDIEDAVGAGVWRILSEYLSDYLQEPETLPPPSHAIVLPEVPIPN